MQNLSPKPSQVQQSQKNKKARKGLLNILLGQSQFSKKMAVFDTVYYIVFAAACIIGAIIWPSFGAICPDLMTIFTTGLVTLRLGYVAKAGVENFTKIKRDFDMARDFNAETEAIEEESEVG